MKRLIHLLALMAVAFGFSSCCSMFGGFSHKSGSYEETYQVKTCGYDIIREEKVIDAKSGLVEVTETKVPRYKTKTRKVHVPCPRCTRFYCPKGGCCGSDASAARKMATAQGPSGSPHIGLIPTMKPIAP